MDLNNSVAILAERSSRLGDKVVALRSLHAFLVESGSSVPLLKQKQIKQLIMDSILYIIMNEDVSSDLHRRQLVKTECILMMANMVDSSMLYEVGTEDLHASFESSADSISVMAASPVSRDSYSPTFRSPATKLLSLKSKIDSSAKLLEHPPSVLLPPVSPEMSKSMSASASPISPDHQSQPAFSLKTRALISPTKIAHSSALHVEQLSDSSVKGFLLRTQKKRLKHRKLPSSRKNLYFLDDDGTSSPGRSLVPGVRSSDFLKQERILGYRAPKTWFPFQVVGVSGSLSPEKRGKTTNLRSKPDDVVEEFLKLKALISYFGDIVKVAPPQPPSSGGGDVVKAAVDKTRFNGVLKEMVHLWTPLLGLSLGQDSKSKFANRLYRKSADQAFDEAAFEQHDLVSYESSTILPIDQLWNLFLSKEKKKKNDPSSSGGKDDTKNPRHILLNVMNKLYECKRRNFLALAMGTWKIHLVIKESQARTQHYARRVGLALVYRFFQKAVRKNFLRSLNMWKRAVSRGMFLERSRYVVRVQTLYRRARARGMMARVAEEAPYNGPFSDIYLAPQRSVAFTIPRAVRRTRRLYWLSAVAVQTYWRMYFGYQGYLRLRARVVLLQSVGRMCPRCMCYRRLRACAVRMQARTRCVVVRRRYLYLRAQTIVAQCCARRFLAWRRKVERLGAIWRSWERRSAKAVALQRRWRIHRAKVVVGRRVVFNERRLWGALFMAKKWYKLRGNFSTFVLMSAYRAREIEDQRIRQSAQLAERKQAVRRMQRFYKVRFAEMVTKFVLRVQCWYRFRRALNYMPLRRERRRCARKIRCWFRLAMRRRNVMARRLQNVWWNFRAQRGAHLRRRHLQRKCARRDERVDAELRYRHDSAAARIQGLCKGVLCRRAIVRSRMAARIQRLVRRLLAAQRRSRERTARKQKAAVQYVRRIVAGCVNRRVTHVVRRQAAMIVRLQACARGLVVRRVAARFKRAAQRYAQCVLKLQRLWRARRLYRECVARVEAERRLLANPFRKCRRVAELFAALRAQTAKTFSFRDPRLGLTVYGFLYRVGRLDLADLFPRQKYRLFLDLRGVTLKRLKELYSEWDKKRRYAESAGSGKSKPPPRMPRGGKGAASEDDLYPLAFFSRMQALLAIDVHTKKPAELEMLRLISPLQEWAQPPEISLYVYNKFFAKFGAAHQAKATNLANAVVTQAWYCYNNYKSVLDVVTLSQVDLAIESSSEASRVRDALRELTQREGKALLQEAAWDRERLGRTLAAHQFCLDQLVALSDPRRAVGRLLGRELGVLGGYLRQYKYSRDSGKAACRDQKAVSDAEKLESLSIVSVDTALALEYVGPSDLDSFDHKVTVLKFMVRMMGAVEGLNKAVSSLKSFWMMTAIKKRLRRSRFQQQAAALNQQYLHDRGADHVRQVWDAFRKAQLAEQRFGEVKRVAAERKRSVEAGLAGVPRHGWELIRGEDGVELYYDRSLREAPQSALPTYSFRQFLAVQSIQRRAHKYLQRLLEHRRYKELLALEEVRRAQELFEKKLQDAFNLVHLRVALREKALLAPAAAAAPAEGVEERLPLRYRLSCASADFVSGSWALLRDAADEHAFESVLVFNIRAGQHGSRLCDAKTFRGDRRNGVDMSRVFTYSFRSGSRVEARFSRQLHFYKGRVSRTRFCRRRGCVVYDVAYDDGEAEEGVAREDMRLEASELAALLAARSSAVKAARAAARRRSHFASLRAGRIERSKLAIGRSEQDFLASWRASGEGSAAKAPGAAYAGMQQCAAGVARSASAEVATRAAYTRVPLRFGWSSRRFSSTRALYAHPASKTLTFSVPSYSIKEERGALKMQSAWFVKKARNAVMAFVYKSPLETIVRNAIADYKRLAFVGYGEEGATNMQMLRRAGYDDVASALEKHDRIQHSKQSVLPSLTLKALSKISKEHFGRFGLTQFDTVRRFIGFQAWFNKTPPDKQRAALSFINHFDGPADPRSLQQCIRAAEDLLVARFTKVHPTGASRNRAVGRAIAESGYPLTHAMLDVYLDKYKDNAEMARESVDELVDIPTTHHYLDERRALESLLNASKRIRVTLSYFKLSIMSDRVRAVLARVQSLVEEGAKAAEGTRELHPGCEGKGALILRCDVLDYLLECVRAAVLLQREARRFVLATAYRRVRAARAAAARAIQRAARNFKSRELYRLLVQQRAADWEQLWDDKRHALYYYNSVTRESMYSEPHAVYRPLVRDRLSARLIQAWPGYKSGAAEEGEAAAPLSATCAVCLTKRSTNLSVDKASREISVCFACYSKRPQSERKDGAETAAASQPLACAACAAPATRKCQGPLGDGAIEDICRRLRGARVDEWLGLLNEFKVAGAQKVGLFMESILQAASGDPKASHLAADSRIDHARFFLERLNAECDETYCTDCYERVHLKGRRRAHKWIGFQIGAAPCEVCRSSPAVLVCDECADCKKYCSRCFPLLHSKGLRLKHHSRPLVEELEGDDRLCMLCSRRRAVDRCENDSCSFFGCDSCYACAHAEQCAAEQVAAVARSAPKKTVGLEAARDKQFCTNCGEQADSRCVQCKDLYCSRTWMGWDGCFAANHQKGFRKTHKCVEVQITNISL